MSWLGPGATGKLLSGPFVHSFSCLADGERLATGEVRVVGMRYVEVSGVRLSVIGLGTWQFGSAEWGYGSAYADRDALEITQRALDLGINLLDTAEMYGFGRSERILGRAIGSRRSEAFLATKLAPVLPFDPVVRNREAASARRLGTDRIDLYQVHWPNPLFPQARLMAALRRLQHHEKVGHVGVSNYSLSRWRLAESALGGPILSNQVKYNLIQRGPEKGLLEWARSNGRVIIAYSPLAQGLLSGRYGVSYHPKGVRASNPVFLPRNLERVEGLLDVLRQVADSHDVTPAQIALAWVVRRPNVVAIPGAHSVAQLESNAAAAEIDLSDEEDRRLTAASDAFALHVGPSAYAEMAWRRFGPGRSRGAGNGRPGEAARSPRIAGSG